MAFADNKHLHCRSRFTLIELLVAMAVLAVLMLMLFQFFGAAQEVWSQSSTNTRIYENARIAMELVERDLQTSVASNATDRQIPFFAGDSDTSTVMVSATDLRSSDAESKLCEVRYYFDSDANTLYRESVCDQDAEWDFYGKHSGNVADSNSNGIDDWGDNANATPQEIIKGVNAFQITFPTLSGTPKTVNTLPPFAQISLTVFDEKLMELKDELGNAWQNRVSETERSFSKTVFFPKRD